MARLCLWAVQSTCNTLVKLANRVNVAYIPQWQTRQNNLARHTCVPGAPALAVRLYEDGQLVLWCIYSVAFSSSMTALVSSLMFYKVLRRRQVREIWFDPGKRCWTDDWHYWTMALPMSTASCFLVLEQWQIQTDTIQSSVVFQCCWDPAVSIPWVVFQNCFKPTFL